MLAKPKLVALDSSTLGKVSHDYWSADSARKAKARGFLDELRDMGVFVALTMTHVVELLRHENEETSKSRLAFLGQMQLVAWLRPYDGNWPIGSVVDLLRRELHVVTHESAGAWDAIVEQARPALWETGDGANLFRRNDECWQTFAVAARSLQPREIYIASLTRTDPGSLFDMKIRDVLRLPMRSAEERSRYAAMLPQILKQQLDDHGDKRLAESDEVAIEFVNTILQDVHAIELQEGELHQKMLQHFRVSPTLVSLESTIGELCVLAVYAKKLATFGMSLRPPRDLTMDDIPPDILPSYALEYKLGSIQRKAPRVSGSDLGDRHVAALLFYADAVEVDKRTFEYLLQLKRDEPVLASLMGQTIRSGDYSEIPGKLGA